MAATRSVDALARRRIADSVVVSIIDLPVWCRRICACEKACLEVELEG